MKRLVLLAAVVLSGCSNKRIDVEGKLVEITPDALVVEVKTKPGMRVDLGVTVDRTGGTPVSADGTARLTLPRARWKGYSGKEIEVAAGKRSFGHETWGSERVPTPAFISSYLRIEKDDSGLWFGALQLGERGEDTFAFDLADGVFAAHVSPKSRKVSFLAAAPPGSEVIVGDSSIKAKKPGIAEGDIPVRALVLGTTLGEKNTTKLEVIVKKDDDEAKFAVDLVASDAKSVMQLLELVGKEVAAVGEGTFFPVRPTITESVVVLDADGKLSQLGKPGPVGNARLVALQTAKRRDGAWCNYTTFSKTVHYDDLEVRVLEARTGKEVGKKKFVPPYVACPTIASSDEAFVWQVEEKTINSWIEKTAFGK